MGRGMRAGKKRPSGGRIDGGRSGGGAANMQKQMAQVQAMQRQMEEIQAELEAKEYETTAGGGAVSVKVNGKREILELNLSQEIVDPDDIEMLQDLVVAAVNEAMRQVEEDSENEMGKLTGGLGIPGL